MTRRVLAAIGAAALLVALAVDCSSTSAACECVEPGITIKIPADIAASVPASGPRLSGTACATATVSCENQTGGCTQYRVLPSAAGTCHIEVDSVGGTFVADVTVIASSGCCSGLYASPMSAADVDVPEPGDAG